MRSRLSFTAMSGRPTTLKSPGLPGTNVHLHLHQIGVDAKDGGAECFEVHVSTDVTTSGGRKSNANASINLVVALIVRFKPFQRGIFPAQQIRPALYRAGGRAYSRFRLQSGRFIRAREDSPC